MYLPVHVGAEGKKDSDGKDLDLGYVKDNTGDNISLKNLVLRINRSLLGVEKC